MAGSGSSLDFGLQTVAGTYTVIARNNTTSCSDNMYGSRIITINSLPDINTITGGGHFCFGNPGPHVGLGGSDTGVNYQLYRGGSTTVGSPMAGIGFPLDFGIQSTPGSYTVVGTNHITGCSSTMAGTAVVSLDTLYTPVVSITAHPTGIKYGQNDTLVATATGAGPGATYQWLINLTYIAGATNATFINNGYADQDSVTCLVTSHTACGSITSFKSVRINILNVGVTTVNKPVTDIRLLPNPNKGVFTVKGSIGSFDDANVVLTITNMFGQVVYAGSAIATGGMLNEMVTLPGSLANGMYLLNVRSGENQSVFHFVLTQ
jgi:Secretion system C-terminal sorting domain